MSAHEIPPAEWQRFFDQFTQQHQQWLARLEPSAQGAGQPLPFRRITFERASTGADCVVIELSQDDRRMTHVVEAPQRVYLLADAQGAHEGLAIETAGGTTTRLRFRAAALPEMVDGIA
jgi:hypothetical protein